MIKNIIRLNENTYIVQRTLSATTTEEKAQEINDKLGTDVLLKNKEGVWFCCHLAKEINFRDVPNKELLTEESLEHTQFELGDNGGLG